MTERYMVGSLKMCYLTELLPDDIAEQLTTILLDIVL
jgi:hypothetical protein